MALVSSVEVPPTWMSRHCSTDTQKVAVFPVPDWDLRRAHRDGEGDGGRPEDAGPARLLLGNDVPALDDLLDGPLLNGRRLLETCGGRGGSADWRGTLRVFFLTGWWGGSVLWSG